MIEAHLPTVSASRRNQSARAYRLHEPDMPVHDGTPESTIRIIHWLGVERHERWLPGGGTTFCNVYAGDLCGLLGAYIPRVWWLPNALAEIAAGRTPTARYAATVGELSANALYRWLCKHSADFGWRRVDTLDEVQAAANAGRAAVICSRRNVESVSGHIAVVAPETDGLQARRDLHGRVTVPVTSQAGGRNHDLAVTTPWWRGTEMAEAGLWTHDPKADTEPAPPPDEAITLPGTPTSKSSQRLQAVNVPIEVPQAIDFVATLANDSEFPEGSGVVTAPDKCPDCGGFVRRMGGEGRTRRIPRGNGARMVIPASVQIPTCTQCGSEWLDTETARALAALDAGEP